MPSASQESGDVADPHPPPFSEVDHLRALAVAELVRGDDVVVLCQLLDVAFPAEFGGGAELAAVEEDERSP